MLCGRVVPDNITRRWRAKGRLVTYLYRSRDVLHGLANRFVIFRKGFRKYDKTDSGTKTYFLFYNV